MNRTSHLFASAALLLALVPASLFAQTADTKSTDAKPAESKSAERAISYEPPPPHTEFVVKTYYLTNTFQQNDANEIMIALRNVLEPWVKIYLDFSQNAIVLSAPAGQQELAQRLISELDRPKRSYRLTFTLAESDSGKRIGVQHFSAIAIGGQRTTLKQGSKIPVVTGSFEPTNASGGTQTQFQYLDIGLNLSIDLNDSSNGLRLSTKVEQSSVSQSTTIADVQEPVVRQTVLESSSIITPGKPLSLGSVDIVGSTRHIDIEVIAEPIS
jgi:type II secretory pathway component GspD/PulD (secretin)